MKRPAWKRAFVNLKGETIGLLTFDTWIAVDRSGHALWLCKCKCGGQKTVAAHNVISGRTQSCGCLRTFRAYENLAAIREKKNKK